MLSRIRPPCIERIWQFQAKPGVRYHQKRRVPSGLDEVEIMISGGGWFEVEGNRQDVSPGTMLWFHSGEPLSAESDATEPYACIVFQFKPSTLPPPQGFTQWASADEAIHFATGAMERFHPKMPDLQLFSLYYESRMRWEAKEFTRRRSLTADAMSLPLEKALSYIANHFTQPIPMRSLAQAAGISSTRLYDLFRKRFGESPLKRITRLRIQHACDLLTTTSLSIKEIGAESGFGDSVHFCRVFRQRLGTSPGAYRRQFEARPS